MKPAKAEETPSQKADRIYAEQHTEKPEAVSEVLTRNEHSVMVADFHNAFCAGSYDRLVAHDDALRAALKKAEEAKDALYESFKELTAMDRHSAFRADAAEARVKTLYALLVEWADEVHIHTDEPCDVGPSCR